MQAIIRFILNRRAFFTWLFLSIMSIILIVEGSNYHNSGFNNSANTTQGNFYKKINSAKEYLALRQINDSLAHEIARLRSTLPEAFYSDTTTIITKYDSTKKAQYTYTWAKVVNSTTEFRNNFITINKGWAQGIRPRSAVLNENGVVGVVKDVSQHYSTIISLLNKKTKLSVRHKRSGTLGNITWDGHNYIYASLNDIPSHVKLFKGDSLITSSFSAIYPDNILVGWITDIDLPDGSSMYTIKIRLAADMKRLSYVFVINNLMQSERDSLENKMKEIAND